MLEKEILEKFKIFGNNVKCHRLKKNKTIKELSQKTGISEKFLKRIEAGTAKRVNVSHIFVIANVLNILPHELYEGI